MALYPLRALQGFHLQAKDRKLGKVVDFYFDDARWIIRYLVVETDGWLHGRRVLIAPIALCEPDFANQILPVNLTSAQIKAAPGIDAELPVSRQKEHELVSHYGWPMYWSPTGPLAGIATPLPPPLPATEPPADLPTQVPAETHLRSLKEVTGYHIHARDGDLGHLDDVVSDSADAWRIVFLVLDTRNWLPGLKVVALPQWVADIDWADAKIYLQLTRAQIRQQPSYDAKQPLTPEQAEQLRRKVA